MILNDFNYSFTQPSSTALLGINGSGKSTMLQLIAGFVLPTKGEITYYIEDKKIEPDAMFHYVSYCAPYLELIEEMTLEEFLHYHFSFKKPSIPISTMIDYIGLHHARTKLIGNFSSGMKQRVKLAQAIFSETPLLLLDEPCTNLDQSGIDLYHRMMQEFGKNKLFIVASNDSNEYAICTDKIQVSEYK